MVGITKQELLERVCKSTCENCFLHNCCIDREDIKEAKKCDYIKKAMRKERWFIKEVLGGIIV